MARRSPWQHLYAAAHGLRERWYRSRATALDRPVVSIGNLHWGGTGKTPLVAATARHLLDRGERVAVLSRGYGRRDQRPRVVSRGDGPEIPHQLAGDEPFLLAEELPGVAIAVAQRRLDAARLLETSLTTPPSIYLLDDGFSHLALRRDLDILVLPAEDPLGGGRLPPGGRLREPLEATGRAHAVCLVGPDVDDNAAAEVGEQLRTHGFCGPVFSCRTAAEPARLEDDSLLATSTRVLVVTGIARPRRVVETALASGFEIADHIAFPDHHGYPARSLETIRAAYREHGAVAVLTTTKDRVKLRHRLDLPLAVPTVYLDTSSLWPWLDAQLATV